MTTERALGRCGRTSAIVAAILDGDESATDRSHIALCATCTRESERAIRFDRILTAAAVEASDGIPAPDGVARVPSGAWASLIRLRVAPIATLAGAVAVGLVLAAVIGSRVQTPAGQPSVAFSTAATARTALASLGLACGELSCQSTAPNHVHRVQLTEDDGRVVEVEAWIESTDGKALDLHGADDLFARIAAAVLAPEAGTATASWIRAEYAACGASCSVDLEQVSIAVEVGSRSASVTLRER